jgi:hypothetical protein
MPAVQNTTLQIRLIFLEITQRPFRGHLHLLEPSTWAMLLIGFAGIGFSAFRKHGQTAMVNS